MADPVREMGPTIVSGFPGEYCVTEHLVLTDKDPDAVNTQEQPDRVVPRRQEGAEVTGCQLHASLAPPSWNVLRLHTPT
jgi:alpha-N-arabinofuranosidase